MGHWRWGSNACMYSESGSPMLTSTASSTSQPNG
eukprot:CAMPEP_0180820170 /NCGR_PEP_ID=MMETSP1038_2-20121128/70135_1 /TAXON_ID=632150 /ORGANISM="Azadinium spinosum, Strain 3D9" /LENGTH=33 /DNA_ID= /DNA_START= /DNA_END= /DNA_ORIENTATION=